MRFRIIFGTTRANEFRQKLRNWEPDTTLLSHVRIAGFPNGEGASTMLKHQTGRRTTTKRGRGEKTRKGRDEEEDGKREEDETTTGKLVNIIEGHLVKTGSSRSDMLL